MLLALAGVLYCYFLVFLHLLGVGLFVINVGLGWKLLFFTVCCLICVCLLLVSGLCLFNSACCLLCLWLLGGLVGLVCFVYV